MRPIRRILAAVGEPGARRLPAAVKAAQLARALNAKLVLFRAISAPLYLDWDVSLLSTGVADVKRSARAECLAALEVLARRLRRTGIKVEVDALWIVRSCAPPPPSPTHCAARCMRCTPMCRCR